MPTPFLWQDRTFSLAERHEQLSRTSQAMWQLLKSKLDLSDDELRLALTQLEANSPLTSEPQLLNCSICHHPVRSTAKNCLYCGAAPRVQTHAIRVVNVSGSSRSANYRLS